MKTYYGNELGGSVIGNAFSVLFQEYLSTFLRVFTNQDIFFEKVIISSLKNANIQQRQQNNAK